MKSKKMLKKKFLNMFKVEEPIDKVISKLQDDSNYYGDYGRQFLSNSDINKLLYSPNEFRKPTPKTKELVMGSYFHTAMLEPDKLKNYEIENVSIICGATIEAPSTVYRASIDQPSKFYRAHRNSIQILAEVDRISTQTL